MVEWSTKVWRIVLPKDNPLLFNDNNLFKVINNNILDKKIRAYDAKDDEFQQELQLPLNIETSSFKIIGLKIREDWFFDNERLVSEARVIGLCPVAINKLQGDTVDLYWVYLPDIRKYLAQAEIYQKGLSPKIRTIDDLFFYRYFWGQIYKESNVHDGSISTYNAGREIDKEAERIEMNIIEREHDIWIGFTK